MVLQKENSIIFLRSSPPRILLIDDSPDLVTIQKMVLENQGYSVISAGSGIQALQYLKSESNFDLILLDMQLEDMTGSEFLQRLEQNNPDILEKVPIVIQSATEITTLGKAVGFIRKVIDLDKFLIEIKNYLQLKPQSKSLPEPLTH